MNNYTGNRWFPSDESALMHYGISGQKWGVRRYQNEDGTLTEEGKQRYGVYDKPDGTKDYKRLRKDAANDASEYARAKAYYGEGAGTRRKLIKNKISERMKDPDYKREFERLLSQQDMSKHQKAATRERKAQDVKNFTGKTARGIKNLLLGAGNATIAALAIYSIAKYTGAGKVIKQYGKRAVSSIVRKANQVRSSASATQKMRRDFGIGADGRINWGDFVR